MLIEESVSCLDCLALVLVLLLVLKDLISKVQSLSVFAVGSSECDCDCDEDAVVV